MRTPSEVSANSNSFSIVLMGLQTLEQHLDRGQEAFDLGHIGQHSAPWPRTIRLPPRRALPGPRRQSRGNDLRRPGVEFGAVGGQLLGDHGPQLSPVLAPERRLFEVVASLLQRRRRPGQEVSRSRTFSTGGCSSAATSTTRRVPGPSGNEFDVAQGTPLDFGANTRPAAEEGRTASNSRQSACP